MKRFILLLCSIFLLFGLIYPNDGQFVVVIDAGHGGRDPGAVRGKVKEKDINLGVSLELGNLIKKNMKDVKVVYTRDKDVFVELVDRASKANKQKANLFISIHTNSTDAKKTSASGADTYILGLARSAENLAVAKRENSVILLEEDYTLKYESFDPNSTESYIIFEFMTNKYMEQSLNFASHIQDKFRTKAKRTDRGVRQAGFLVLRNTSMPSVLIELGFINNATEATFLSSKNGQKVMAESIYEGFKKYKEAFDKRDVKNIQVETTPPVNSKDIEIAPTIKESPTTTPKSQNQGIVEYRVQFMYSAKKLPSNSKEFKGLSPVSHYYENGYKYTYGSTIDADEIQKQLKLVKTKFKDAFVIRMKDGKRIK